jgi:YjbE family integral membrane protein
MLAALTDPEMWTALVKIAIINVVLSGDNAVVIALACRSLNPKDQRKAFIIGTAGIVVLMTILTIFAAALMTVPYLQLIGSILLLWIGIKLLLPENDNDDLKSSSNFWEAVRTIIIADIVMSLDNVLGMAGAAKGHYAMLFLGLLITMPLILFGSALLMKLMERFPVFVTIGAALIGYVAGEMVIGDMATHEYVEAHLAFLDKYFVAALGGAVLVVVVGKVLGKRKLLAAASTSEAQARQT